MVPRFEPLISLMDSDLLTAKDNSAMTRYVIPKKGLFSSYPSIQYSPSHFIKYFPSSSFVFSFSKAYLSKCKLITKVQCGILSYKSILIRRTSRIFPFLSPLSTICRRVIQGKTLPLVSGKQDSEPQIVNLFFWYIQLFQLTIAMTSSANNS